MTNNSANKDMLGRTALLPLSAALEKLHAHLDQVRFNKKETIPLAECLNRVTAMPICAAEDLPPQPRSTVDGYAVMAKETFGASESMPAYLKVSGEVLMGEVVSSGPRKQECYKIATGGFLPPGTDAVIMLEHTVNVDPTLVEVIKAVAVGGNVLAAGDDLQKGAIAIPQGKKLRSQELGLLAGLGCIEVDVFKKVSVGIFSTGDEIVSYDQSPPPGKMRDTNGLNLASLVLKNGGSPHYYGIVPDQEGPFEETLALALAENDLVIFSGSSSVGTRDLGEQTIAKLATPGIIVHGVAIKPGKPVIIAFAGQKPIFGLPGHPVSAAVAFDLFTAPSIVRVSGLNPSFYPTQKPAIPAQISRNLNSAPGRTDFVRVKLSEPEADSGYSLAHPVLGKSGALSTMVQADGYIIIEESSQGVYKDEIVNVHILD